MGKITYTITTTKNQKNQINTNTTTIDLGHCETKLKEEYNISMNESLYILKIDILIDYMVKIEYEVYYNFSSNNLTKLNLTFCKDIKIDILIPKDIPLNEIDKYNKSSGYYNDICYTLINSEIDETIKDRIKDYKKNNMSICEEDCEFTEYNPKTKKVKCSCNTKINLPIISDIKINKEKLYSNFKDIRNIGNFKMLHCIKLFLNESNKFKNLSNYMLLLLLTLSVISILSFSFNDFKKIIEFLNNIEMKKSNKIMYENIKTSNNKKNQNKIINKNNSNIINSKKIKKKKKKLKKKINIKNNFNKNLGEVGGGTLKKQFIIKEKLEKEEILNDFELSELEYKDAIKKDNRTFIQLYISLLKKNHILIFSFFNLKDYNSYTIKIFIFFFTFSINLIVSAMFYSDATMHKIYIDQGIFDFTYQLPQMFYSLIISTVLNQLLNLLGIYEQSIVEFNKNSDNNKEKILKKIKIKIILFFIIDYVLIFFFWIYLGCFCYVYRNTQIHLLIDVTSSFALSFITPFFIFLLPSFFWILSLSDKNGKRNLLFKFSKFLENF